MKRKPRYNISSDNNKKKQSDDKIQREVYKMGDIWFNDK